MKLANQLIDDGRTIDIDDGEFIGCTFRRCTLRYSGAPKVNFASCSFEDGALWQFAGPAANALQILAKIYAMGATKLIEATFAEIKGQRSTGGLLH